MFYAKVMKPTYVLLYDDLLQTYYKILNLSNFVFRINLKARKKKVLLYRIIPQYA